MLHRVARVRVVHEEQRRLLPAKIVQSLAKPPEQKRCREFLVTQSTRVAVQPIHGLDRDQQRYDENYRDGEEAHNEPRAQGHFRGVLVGGVTAAQLQVRRRGARHLHSGYKCASSSCSVPRPSVRDAPSNALPMHDLILRIAALRDHVGSTVTLRRWVTHLRSSGKVAFAVFRDGTGIAQAVFVKTALPAEMWQRFASLTLETSVMVRGEVRADARAPGGFEISVADLEIIGPSPLDYPIQPKEHGIDFLLDHRHFWLRSNRQRAIFLVRNEIEQAIHDFFYERSFLRFGH